MKLYVDPSGRLTPERDHGRPVRERAAANNTAAIIPVYESQLTPFKQIVTSTLTTGNGNDSS